MTSKVFDVLHFFGMCKILPAGDVNTKEMDSLYNRSIQQKLPTFIFNTFLFTNNTLKI